MSNENKQYRVFVVGFSLIVVVILAFLLKPLFSNWKNREKNLAEQKVNEEILKAPSITADELFQKIQDKSKIFLVDISASDDFKRGHIALAKNMPAENLNKDFFRESGVDAAADIFIVNQGGDLAALAQTTNRVVADGFANAKYLRGGIADWREQGYPLVSAGGSEEDNAKVKKITIDEIKKDAGTNPLSLQFLDVRDKNSYAAEHIVGAINVPLGEIEAEKNNIPALKKVIVYGSNDDESFQAAVALFDLNFFNIYQMQGSIEDWKAAEGNTASGDQ